MAGFGCPPRIQPVVRFTFPEVEVPVAFLDVDIVAESAQFIIYRFECYAHGPFST